MQDAANLMVNGTYAEIKEKKKSFKLKMQKKIPYVYIQLGAALYACLRACKYATHL